MTIDPCTEHEYCGKCAAHCEGCGRAATVTTASGADLCETCADLAAMHPDETCVYCGIVYVAHEGDGWRICAACRIKRDNETSGKR